MINKLDSTKLAAHVRKQAKIHSPNMPATALPDVVFKNAYDYGVLSSFEEFKGLADDATLIFALDKNGKGLSPVYGLEVMRMIMSEVIPTQKFAVVTFVIDFHNGNQLEHLSAAVEVLKGVAEYNGPEEKEA